MREGREMLKGKEMKMEELVRGNSKEMEEKNGVIMSLEK